MSVGSLKLWRGPMASRAASDVAAGRKRGDVSLVHLLYQGAVFLGLFVGSYLFFSHFVVQSVQVSGSSMVPALQDADRCLVNRIVALFRAPHRGEIVVLKDPTDNSCAVKRIIGLAGETVELRGGAVFVNGERLREAYLPPGTQTFPFETLTQTVHCGPNQFFVLGDNRFYSSDSRNYGPVKRGAILGLVAR